MRTVCECDPRRVFVHDHVGSVSVVERLARQQRIDVQSDGRSTVVAEVWLRRAYDCESPCLRRGEVAVTCVCSETCDSERAGCGGSESACTRGMWWY